MAKTTIQLDADVKDRLDKRKTESESYNAAVKRLCDGSGALWTEQELRDLIREELREARR